jgi:hypothetical protein
MRVGGWERKDYRDWWERCSFCKKDVMSGWVRDADGVRFGRITVSLDHGISIVIQSQDISAKGQIFMCDKCTPFLKSGVRNHEM